jgi:ribonuclease P protein component
MIGRKHRFHGHNSLRFVYGNGRTVRCSLGALKFAPNSRRQTYRAAVVVSKKNSKSAVVRNRIRRRIYEVIRLNTPETCALDMVFTVFSDQLADAPVEQLQKTIIGLLQEAGVVQGTKHATTGATQDKKQRKPTGDHGIVKPKESSKS